jgi:CSLREA domain-containing protein
MMSTRRFKILSHLSTPVRWLVILLLVVPVPTARSARAAPDATPIVVATAIDDFGGSFGCSLREAIQSANTDTAFGGCAAGSGDDIITLPAGTYTLTGAAGENSNASGDLDIRSNLTINGAGEETTIIQAGTDVTNGVDRVLHIPDTANVEINNVTIRYGKTVGGSDGAFGTTGEHGGGINIQWGTLTLNDCTVSDNRTGGGGDGSTSTGGNGADGGGIYNRGTLILNDTDVTSNETGGGGNGGAGSRGGSGGRGGGIYLSGSSAMTLTNSAIGSNATGNGGSGGDAVNSDAGDGGDGGHCGGVYANQALLTLIDSAITENTTGSAGQAGDVTSGNGDGGNGGNGGHGAGIFASGSTTSLVIVDSVIGGNEVGLGTRGGAGFGTGSSGADGDRGDGGGIYVGHGHAVLSDSSLLDNEAHDGGGIYSNGVTVKLDSCTVAGNIAHSWGGGIYGSSTLELTNCTVSGNDADEYAGGIYNGGGGTMTLTHVTLVVNTADDDSNGSGDGGGFLNYGTFTMTNTIVAENTDNGGENPDCHGTVISGDYNLLRIGDSAGCAFTAQANDLVGTASLPVSPVLGPLFDNGGSTWTHVLSPGSPGHGHIPAGANGCGEGGRDQRGVLRFPSCNIGSYEQDEIEHVYLPLVLKGG